VKPNLRRAALRAGYRSGLELDLAKELRAKRIKFTYEELKIKWDDSRIRTYTPDFQLPNGIIIESKGRFVATDRVKHLRIKDQYKDYYDIRFVFSNPKNKLNKRSKTTYADWCDRNGFEWAWKHIPQEWIDE